MYRFYAEAFFLTISLLGLSIIFDLDSKISFFHSVDMVVFLLLAFTIITFPFAFIFRHLIRVKKVIIHLSGNLFNLVGRFSRSTFSRILTNTISLLIIGSVALSFCWLCFTYLSNSIVAPIVQSAFRKTVYQSVSATLAEIDAEQWNFSDYQCKDALSSSVSEFKDYFKTKEYNGFIARGARQKVIHSYDTDSEGQEVTLQLQLTKPAGGDIDQLAYLAYQELPGTEVYGYESTIYINDFNISSYDEPALHLETLEIPNPAGIDILILWWNSTYDTRYAVFSPLAEKDTRIGAFKLKCLVGCDYDASGSQAPVPLVQTDPETGTTQYLIETAPEAGLEIYQNKAGELDVKNWVNLGVG